MVEATLGWNNTEKRQENKDMKKHWILALVVIATLLLNPLIASATPANNPIETYALDRILVKFQPGTDEAAQTSIHQKHGGQVVEAIPGIDVKVVKVPRGKVLEKVKAYLSEGSVKFAELDGIVQATVVPNDPGFGNQWGMTKIQADKAWDITSGSSSIKIAILDTGIDQNHPDLSSKIVANKNFTRSRTVDDKYGHGTHVAGIAAAITNNGIGVAGVGYNSSLMNVKVLGDNGAGFNSWIAKGITWATDNGAKVINMSLGGGSSSSTVQNAVNYAWSKGVVIVAAAGNNNSSSLFYPAAYPNVISVAATDQNDAKASFSNYGSWVTVSAPGVDIYSTLPNHTNAIGQLNYGYLSGTSMASPHVAGLAALIFARYPTWTNADVRGRIQSSTYPTTGFSPSLGRINAYKAVQ